MFTIVKILLSAVIIACITALAGRFPTYGGIVAALPLVSLLSILWLHLGGAASDSLSQFVFGVVKGLPATIVMMLIIGYSLQSSLHLIISLLLGICGWFLVLFFQQWFLMIIN
ncbi:hypothetical protein JCM19045_4432 [Bacillus sp. JCM 19045]|uniref:DUF3147 family protein n=1 Tax=Shouchella xiaoxiensis TaxID=766895 RepID=A0ABS2STI1_9BACI|nr:DUF3147 family protein [Shouchella xiaoxiensis]MBM7838817.1 hypothetical protein [Shouchella xiaoxiensis]GAF15087.1 hypothetical protein JCM19045_4432 [Bacillus sp. JCM 19045]